MMRKMHDSPKGGHGPGSGHGRHREPRNPGRAAGGRGEERK